MSVSRRDFLFGGLTRQLERVEPEGTVSWQESRPRVRPAPAPTANQVARVMPFSCLNQLGGFCGTCVERCPVEGAIAMDGRLPKVNTTACNGCGDCHRLCPAPGKAILMVPEGL